MCKAMEIKEQLPFPRKAPNSLGKTYFLLRKIENRIVGKLRTSKGKVHWGIAWFVGGERLSPRKDNATCKYSFLKEV
jgi:hypothetical protein